MSAFANWSISRKLMAAFAGVIAVIFVSSAIIYSRLLVIDEARTLRVRTMDVLDTLQTAMDAILDQETGLRGFLVTGEETFLEPYYRGSEVFPATFQKVISLTSDNAVQQARLAELGGRVETWHSEIAEQSIALMAKPETREDARGADRLRNGKTAMDLIRANVNEIASTERALLAMRDVVQEEAFTTAYAVTVLGGATSLIIAAIMAMLLTRSMTVPITRMTGAMVALAHGDTGVEVPGARRRDEFGAMATAMHVFKHNIIERQKTQAELAHVNRVATMGQLTASIAHEVNQPIGAAVVNAQAALRWLAADPPDLSETKQALGRVVENGKRAGDVIDRIRLLIKKAPPRPGTFNINEAITDIVALTRSEIQRHGAALRTEFTAGLPPVEGDRIQLQQVILNLILNAMQAMSSTQESARDLVIRTAKDASGDVLVSVADSGPGVDTKDSERLFEAFYTTKPDGMGMGLAICRSIIEGHGGRLWATANSPRGAVFQFTLPSTESSA